ncbi:MAG: hypothetical protein K1X88_19015 [Nannocystaceae bacterium]|nr:hypothetical protein [Nannocystaceae bacterium]
MPRRFLLPAVSLFTLPLLACADPGDGDDDATPRVSFYEHALPILEEHCSGCHQDGGIAPFATGDYATAKQWAAAIVESVENRSMPPFGANNDGSCNEFVDARWLSDDEIETLRAWLDDGAVEGDPPEQPSMPKQLPTLTGAGIEELETPMYTPVAQTEPGEEYEDYQCFILPTGADHDRYIVGFEVLPGNARTVHHVLGFRVNPTVFDNAKTMQALDDASPDQLGWDCFGAAGDGVFVDSVPVTWAPGTGAVHFPPGTGIPMLAEDVLVVQVHYNLLSDHGPDSSKIRVQYADTVERPAVQTLWDPFLYSSILGTGDLSLPPGQEHASYAWDEQIATMTNLPAGTEVEIHGLLPHMHKRGRTMSIELERFADGGSEMSCAADIDRYDFNWQSAYYLKQPLVANTSHRIHVACDWDTREDTAPVLPGFSTANEMCLVGVYVVPR